jgi:hypothetical protein
MFKRTLILAFILVSCDEIAIEPTNPLDPNNPDYTAPQISILSPSDNEIINTSSIIFNWEGNRDGMLFRYEVDSKWSDWNENKSVQIDHYDEGSHSFSAQSKYATGDTSAVATINFEVDAVEGPSLLFNPRYQESAVSQIFQLSLLAEEVTNISGAEVILTFDPEIIEVVDVLQGELFNELGQIIFIEDHSSSFGTITISTAVWGNDKPAATGTKSLAEIQVRLKKSGNATIGIESTSTFRDPDNQTITINQFVGAIVESD